VWRLGKRPILTQRRGSLRALAVEGGVAGKPRAECRIVSEAVWARGRQDYEGGMTAQAVADLHGMTVAAIRGRINREGWSRAAHSARNSPPSFVSDVTDAPTEPEAIRRGALARASAALLAGRPAEATAIVQALDAVLELAVAAQPAIPLEEALARNLGLARSLQDTVRGLAEQLLGDGEVFERDARWAFAWRAKHLGPEAEARDRAYAARMGWTDWLFDADGRLTPEPTEAEVLAKLVAEVKAESAEAGEDGGHEARRRPLRSSMRS